MSLKEDITRLTKLKRNGKNLEKIQEFLTELETYVDGAEAVTSAIAEAREKMQALEDELDGSGDDNPLTAGAADLRIAVEAFLDVIPEEGQDIGDLVTEANGYAQEYENSIGDREYTAENRDEIWGNLLDALENITEALT